MMTDKEEIEYYRNTAHEMACLLCNAMGVNIEKYDTDQSDAQCYLDCVHDAVDCLNTMPPIENGKNRYGVDVSYFRKTINRELNRSLANFKPSELARVFARLSVTADSQVIFESEFQSRRQSTCTANEVLMPKELTAENGAKALLMGEFSVGGFIECGRCDQGDASNGDDEYEECEFCEGQGGHHVSFVVDWPTIKEIYAKAVEHLGA